MSEGYIYIASLKKLYYELGLESAMGLRDFHPEANITLYTHDKFIDDDRPFQVFNNVVTNIPIHRRAKMWCMARTPYDKTYYNDCDSFVVHPDISKVFNDMGDKIYMCKNLMHTVSQKVLTYFDNQGNFPIYHGAVAWYKKNDYNIEFMDAWWKEYIKQLHSPWDQPYNPVWQRFDMFTLWRLHTGRIPGLEKFDGAVITGDRRFNCTTIDGRKNDTKLPPVVMQFPRSDHKKLEGYKPLYKRLEDAPTFTDWQYTTEDSIEFN